MSILTKADIFFIEKPSRLKNSNKDLARSGNFTIEELQVARNKYRILESATSLISELESSNYKGSLKEVAKTVLEGNAEQSLDFKIDIVKRQCESKTREQEEKYKILLKEYETINNAYNDVLRLAQYPTLLSVPKLPEYKRQGSSIIIYSDWHLGQIVEKKSLNGLNEYNPEIAKKRALTCFDSTVKLINRDIKDFDNHTTVIFLNGDFINGYIHPESQRITNSMTPIEEVVYAQELLTTGLNFILENSKSDNIKVICTTGNHARQEKRMESSIDHRTSYETMLYSSLANKFEGEIEFVLPQSDISYTSILGKTVRNFHGHQVSYGGGIGGLTIPLTKFIQRQDTNKKAHYNIMSHYHQCSLPTKNSMLNGSLVGMDNYCQSIGATGELPQQAYRLLDSKYGFTSFNPIICQ